MLILRKNIQLSSINFYTIAKFLLIFSKCSLALILSAVIELVLISPELPEGDDDAAATVGLIVMFNALPSLLRSSPELSTSICFLSDGDGDLTAGDWMLLDGLMVEIDDEGIIERTAAEDVGMHEGGMWEWDVGMLWGEILMPPLGCAIANWLILMLPGLRLIGGVR